MRQEKALARGFPEAIEEAAALTRGARIFGYQVDDPRRYGVVEVNAPAAAFSKAWLMAPVELPELPEEAAGEPGEAAPSTTPTTTRSRRWCRRATRNTPSGIR